MTLNFDAAFYEQLYRSRGAVWSGNPNPQLVREVADLAPGTALDIGCGEGADAIWLAARGWRVTAVDFSATAIARAAARAAELGPPVDGLVSWLRADLAAWHPGEAAYDLVSAQFFHPATGVRDGVFRRLAAAVAPGGTLLIVGHHPADILARAPQPVPRDAYFTAPEVAATLDSRDWAIVAAEDRARQADAAGHASVIRDVVLRARRAMQPGAQDHRE